MAAPASKNPYARTWAQMDQVMRLWEQLRESMADAERRCAPSAGFTWTTWEERAALAWEWAVVNAWANEPVPCFVTVKREDHGGRWDVHVRVTPIELLPGTTQTK